MPVNILYCEGVPKSPDVRVLSTILPPGYVVRPIGSKQGLAFQQAAEIGKINSSLLYHGKK